MDTVPMPDLDGHFDEINLKQAEINEILKLIRAANPVRSGHSFTSWDEIFFIDGTLYKVYGALGNYDINERSWIVRMDPVTLCSDK
jgi:hypothetical protein